MKHIKTKNNRLQEIKYRHTEHIRQTLIKVPMAAATQNIPNHHLNLVHHKSASIKANVYQKDTHALGSIASSSVAPVKLPQPKNKGISEQPQPDMFQQLYDRHQALKILPWYVIKASIFFVSGCLLMIYLLHG